jgi:hypothetical protein
VSQYLTGSLDSIAALFVERLQKTGELEERLRQDRGRIAGAGSQDTGPNQPLSSLVVWRPSFGRGDPDEQRHRHTAIEDLDFAASANLAEVLRELRLELGHGGSRHVTIMVLSS